MKVALPPDPAGQVTYQLPLDEERLPLNGLLGESIRMTFTGEIHCIHCGRRSNKSFNQGYCYPCFAKLAQCDSCIVSPEKCHYFEGTCREPEWADSHCMVDHIVYLANSSGVKVGITRESQLPTRWIDQGAVQALPIMRVKTRQQSGLVETAMKQYVADKTNWRTMLKGQIEAVELPVIRDELFDRCETTLSQLEEQFGIQSLQRLEQSSVVDIDYPVLNYPSKVASLNMDKNPVVEGTLQGIKGQYLILDSGVINIRKYTAYHVEVAI
ncbi:DUF2797 domain-containing protein [Porticoccus litoralis]|uniref:DUF2797 domain-containing protein n=1 Tax=Porticoccus litoralis TaxID=434086 RepID=A0AAW8B4V1_9GAMM|nr:DUF2797 domain-containing protein [Porticoccus litoralis]MDP1521234.1 DUF2797 domain-containing protein [Porticoccus litoralis]TNE94166.1 MAG: DUF2797 domain-containing protein [Gammaproteobacteria bacterium]